ncbi:FAD-binding oxidoreductase [Reyranella sp. CPCC 100927]|uniref:NAD(P)/FAD-dependent oxidoreductase n=1 Tax=Reyranella sp. CPCC 100927 TaxID=2599616 RepID=UPI0011B375C4|nr:FAD-dependent oxidoreductase [Reyranella sp. CPCC 100927]TWT15817.1 FAD-binding oxidoreductase [Reyranella sp. CPCC 100927]
MTKAVTVIGAGAVGVCCALYLQREGFSVELIDRSGPGAGASAGNAGNLGIASCVPAALPGVLRKVPRMLFDSTSPLKLRWRHLPRALPWFVRFIAAARPAQVEAIADARQQLLSRLHEGLDPLVAEAGAQALIEHSGLLMTFESEAAFASAAYAIDLRRRRGVAMDILDGNEARQIEPALTPAIVRAIHVPRLAHTVDPLRLTQALARCFERNGGRILRAAVRGFEMSSDGPRRILTDGASVDADRIVLAAGVWSRPLAAQLGTRVPLEAERGYHTMFAHPQARLRVALMSADRYIAVTPMADGVRATGMAEFAAPDAPPDMDNARRVSRHAQALVPGLTADRVSEWMGPRPSHPDSKPVIGRSPRFANVYFAFGHDHIGLALSGITGKLIGELVAGRPTSVDLTPFRPDRF